MPRPPSVIEELRAAWPAHKAAAVAAYDLFVSYCDEHRRPPRVPGMDTVLRMAIRLRHGRTIEEAAAAEYLYRWRLSLQSVWPDKTSVFASHYAPHLLGA